MSKKKQNSSMASDIASIGGAGLMMGGIGIAAGKTGMTDLGGAMKTGAGFLSPMVTLNMTGHMMKGVKRIQKEMGRLY